MRTQQTLEALSQNVEQFKVMKETLDHDIARAAMACVKAEDATLMQQLVGSVPPGHEFSPMLIQLALEMRSAKAEAPKAGADADEYRDEIARIAHDITEAHTETIEIESSIRESLFNIALRFVPADSLPSLAGEIIDMINAQQKDGVIGHLPAFQMFGLLRIHEQGE